MSVSVGVKKNLYSTI